jgi:hypothetical protein
MEAAFINIPMAGAAPVDGEGLYHDVGGAAAAHALPNGASRQTLLNRCLFFS